MIPILSLWLPILLSSAAVFLLSSLVHKVLKYHNSDYKKLPSEDQITDAIRSANAQAGDYIFPYCETMEERNSKEFKEKVERGPAGVITIFPAGPVSMGSSLFQWFIYSIIVGIFAAYVSGRALGPGADYLEVFRFSGVTAFTGYSLALMQNSIWFKRSWATTIKSMFDGLIYALVTA